MPVFRDRQHFFNVMSTLFNRLNAMPNATDDFINSGLTIRLRCHAPEVTTVIYTEEGNELHVIEETEGGINRQVDLELEMTADLIHQIWMDEVRLRDALFRGDIRIKGSPFRVLHLAELFRTAEEIYPDIYTTVNN